MKKISFAKGKVYSLVFSARDNIEAFLLDNNVQKEIIMCVMSLTSYVISVMMKKINIKKYLVSVGFNRMMIELSRSDQKGNLGQYGY